MALKKKPLDLLTKLAALPKDPSMGFQSFFFSHSAINLSTFSSLIKILAHSEGLWGISQLPLDLSIALLLWSVIQ